MLVDKVAILQEIIDRQGDCSDIACPAVCKRCPLGNKLVNGRKVNCMDYLNITPEMRQDQISEKYAKAAEDELFEIEMEGVLSTD